jgi:putative colanic acid biosynthesis acetyltransferase WcaB
MTSLKSFVFQDWAVNCETSLKSRLALLLFRSANFSKLSTFQARLMKPSRAVYQILVEWVLGIEIPWNTTIGESLQLQHGHGIVINAQTVIGDHCILRHTTTIGNKRLADGSYTSAPTIGNYVDIGCHVVILGDVKIGDRAVIGAGSVVIRDVPEGGVVVGNPARLIRVEPQPLQPVQTVDLATDDVESAVEGILESNASERIGVSSF